MFWAVALYKPNDQTTYKRLSAMFVWSCLRISVGYGGPTVESSRTGRKSTQQVFGRGVPPCLRIHHGEALLKLRPVVKSWGCTTVGVVAPLAPKSYIMSKGYRYNEAVQSLPITTMTNECGIGYVSRWLQKPLAYE